MRQNYRKPRKWHTWVTGDGMYGQERWNGPQKSIGSSGSILRNLPQIDSIMALSPWPGDNERDKELIRRAFESEKYVCLSRDFSGLTEARDTTFPPFAEISTITATSLRLWGRYRTSASVRKRYCVKANPGRGPFSTIFR